ncbi:MAG TPA: TlpA disulfide reductase family protein [Pricia sp.]|nr:TlpA disulfide reductase family protein [Pricia sp.]
MRAFQFLSAVGIIFLISACQDGKVDQGTSIDGLHISKAYPQPGDSLRIIYKAKDSLDDAPTAYFNYLVNDRYYPKDIELKEVASGWEGSFAVPDSASALTYHFERDGEPDTNGKKGYQQLLYTAEEKPLPGSRASLGYFYLTGGERFGIEKDKDSALALMKADLDANTPLMERWDNEYLWVLHKQDKNKGEKLITDRIKVYRKKDKLSEEEHQNLSVFYGTIGKETAADSIKSIAIAKFPKGSAAKHVILSKFFKEKDLDQKKNLVAEFKSVFGKDAREMTMMHSILARECGSTGDLEAFAQYAGQISDESRKAGLFNSVAWNLVQKGENLDFAEKTSKKSLDIVKALQNNPESKPVYLSAKQYDKSLKGNYLMFVDTYAFILFKQGKIAEALKFQKEALGEKNVGRPDVNERYVQFLMADKRWEEAQKEASRFIKINKSTKKTKEYLKEAYVANNGSADGFTGYLEGLEKEANKEAFAAIKAKMIDEEGHDFTLKNLDGEEVTLSGLQGKTVILDFWATWCGPCKDSFPGMQMAVDKYKDDPNVVFLFIDTWEEGTPDQRKNRVTDFIAENNYTFNVLFDNPVAEGSRDFVTTDKYQIKGIPTKVILGPDGNIKFKAVGNIGNGDHLVRELDIMIGLSQS